MPRPSTPRLRQSGWAGLNSEYRPTLGPTTVQKDSFGACSPAKARTGRKFGLLLSMTRFAFAGSWLIEEHFCSLHIVGQFMAIAARHPAMSAFERKWRALVVVEISWLPARCFVAAGTLGRIFARGKLARVRIAMASGALLWSSTEVNASQVALKCCGTMAIAAGYSPVRTRERKIRFRMVKPA